MELDEDAPISGCCCCCTIDRERAFTVAAIRWLPIDALSTGIVLAVDIFEPAAAFVKLAAPAIVVVFVADVVKLPVDADVVAVKMCCCCSVDVFFAVYGTLLAVVRCCCDGGNDAVVVALGAIADVLDFAAA